jgi:hypothetical protein
VGARAFLYVPAPLPRMSARARTRLGCAVVACRALLLWRTCLLPRAVPTWPAAACCTHGVQETDMRAAVACATSRRKLRVCVVSAQTASRRLLRDSCPLRCSRCHLICVRVQHRDAERARAARTTTRSVRSMQTQTLPARRTSHGRASHLQGTTMLAASARKSCSTVVAGVVASASVAARRARGFRIHTRTVSATAKRPPQRHAYS